MKVNLGMSRPCRAQSQGELVKQTFKRTDLSPNLFKENDPPAPETQLSPAFGALAHRVERPVKRIGQNLAEIFARCVNMTSKPKRELVFGRLMEYLHKQPDNLKLAFLTARIEGKTKPILSKAAEFGENEMCKGLLRLADTLEPNSKEIFAKHTDVFGVNQFQLAMDSRNEAIAEFVLDYAADVMPYHVLKWRIPDKLANNLEVQRILKRVEEKARPSTEPPVRAYSNIGNAWDSSWTRETTMSSEKPPHTPITESHEVIEGVMFHTKPSAHTDGFGGKMVHQHTMENEFALFNGTDGTHS